MLYPAKIYFNNESETKISLDIEKPEEFITSRSVLQEMLKKSPSNRRKIISHGKI